MKTLNDILPDLEKMVQFVRDNRDLPCPFVSGSFGVCVTGEQNQRESLAAYARAFGSASKEPNQDLLSLNKYFGEIRFYVLANRDQVCRKIVKTTEVPERVIPAQEAKVIPAHVEEIVEWDCQPILAESKSELASV